MADPPHGEFEKTAKSWQGESGSGAVPVRGSKRDTRVSREFKPRSFRHYQTLCIDTPVRDGKQAVYSYRHLVQALVVRKLMWVICVCQRL